MQKFGPSEGEGRASNVRPFGQPEIIFEKIRKMPNGTDFFGQRPNSKEKIFKKIKNLKNRPPEK